MCRFTTEYLTTAIHVHTFAFNIIITQSFRRISLHEGHVSLQLHWRHLKHVFDPFDIRLGAGAAGSRSPACFLVVPQIGQIDLRRRSVSRAPLQSSHDETSIKSVPTWQTRIEKGGNPPEFNIFNAFRGQICLKLRPSEAFEAITTLRGLSQRPLESKQLAERTQV